MKIKIDDELLKLRDPRIDSLRRGKLSLEAFAMTVGPSDPYILAGDTVYALTEREYYASRPVLPASVLTEKAVEWVLGCSEAEKFREADRALVDRIRKDLPGCPQCRFRRHASAVAGLVKTYGLRIPGELLDRSGVPDIPEYPETLGDIVPKVGSMIKPLYPHQPEKRRPCLDCVEKHLSQAYVLSREMLQGYPEYISLAAGHLGEAFDEMPDEMKPLKDAVEFCLARTLYSRTAFVPLNLLAPVLEMFRTVSGLEAHADGDEDTAGGLYELEFSDAAAAEIAACPAHVKERAGALCVNACNFIPGVENPGPEGRMPWEGCMGQLADTLADCAPSAAAVVRNRRLLFGYSPAAAKEAGCSTEDLLELLRK